MGTTSFTLRAVAETLSKEWRGGRQADGCVYIALGYEVSKDHGRLGHAVRGDGLLACPNGHHWQSLSRFTTNLDDARRLVPPGHDYLLQHVNGGLTISARVGDVESFGETDELALVSASLLAWADIVDADRRAAA